MHLSEHILLALDTWNCTDLLEHTRLWIPEHVVNASGDGKVLRRQKWFNLGSIKSNLLGVDFRTHY